MIELPDLGIIQRKTTKAQRDQDAINWLRWFVEWGSTDCDEEHGFNMATGRDCLWKEFLRKPVKRRDCRKCWQELKDKLAELEEIE